MKKTYNWRRGQSVALVALLLLAKPAVSPLQARSIDKTVVEWQLNGRIVSQTGEGLPGVTVVVKGTTNGTTSGPDGAFTLAVPETAGTLVFSYIGYQTQEHKFAGTETFTTVKL
ncbi:MAG TPA: carboxypeptidase-like regulatory domain-containing protein, partial [Hymenobacter sp.]